jgi:hypothetical protein
LPTINPADWFIRCIEAYIVVISWKRRHLATPPPPPKISFREKYHSFIEERKGPAAPPESHHPLVVSLFTNLLGSLDLLSGIFALLLQLFTIITLAVVMGKHIFVDHWAVSGNSIYLVYITSITILATIVSSLTSGSIRKMLLQRTLLQSSPSAPQISQRDMRILTGIGGFFDSVRGWKMAVGFVISALVTTSIVAGLGARSIVCKFEFIGTVS